MVKLVCFFFESANNSIKVGEMATIHPMWTPDAVEEAMTTGIVEKINEDGSFETWGCCWKPQGL